MFAVLVASFGPCGSYVYTEQAEKPYAHRYYRSSSRSYFVGNGVEIVTNRPSPTVVARADVANYGCRFLFNLLGMCWRCAEKNHGLPLMVLKRFARFL